jgi:hypothetical protein
MPKTNCRYASCSVIEPLSPDGFCELHADPEDRSVTRKNKGKPKLTKAMLMPVAMQALVEIIEFGEGKYGPATDKGWLNYKPDEVLDSLARHLVALTNGELNDPESGKSHAAAVMFNAAVFAELTLEDVYFETTGKGT